MIASEPTNAQRAEWARKALAVFTAETYGGKHPDTMHRGDLQSAICDLICDLLHLGTREDVEALTIHELARNMFEQEQVEEARCNCADRSWYGKYHDTHCPVRIKADVDAGRTEESSSPQSIPYWLDALLDIKRLAGKAGDDEADPLPLLDLIAEKARAAIKKATKQ